ncbi:MAG: hypothetical protein KDB90_02405 [Planctomycetes bacterium]|nr:hypothetical protein [Planctomycetota bacterium]
MPPRVPASVLLFIACLAAFVAATGPVVRAKDKDQQAPAHKPAAPAPTIREFTEKEVEHAQQVTGEITPERAMLVNNLRYLLRPEYELELLFGRANVPCALTPFERDELAPMTVLSNLRLWAVLQSGMATTDAVRMQLERFLCNGLPDADMSLANFGIELGICVSALQRPELESRDQILERARDLVDLAMRVRTGTDADSPLIVGSVIRPMWFANHLWRGLICRFALAMEIKINEHVWETALRNLCGAVSKKRGWCGGGRAIDASFDFDTNLLAMAAASVAMAAPEGTLKDSVIRGIEKAVECVPATLLRLEREYPTEPITGSRLAVLGMLNPAWAPQGREPEAWRKAITGLAVSDIDPTGAVRVDDHMGYALGLTPDVDSRVGRVIADTALSCIALGGGLACCTEPLLAKAKLSEVGREMYAFSVIHAASLEAGTPLMDVTDEATDRAIHHGCEYLISIQAKDGSFQSYIFPGAQTAASLLALMHGDWKRDSDEVKRGMEWLSMNYVPGHSYSDALVLMCFQKFYEAEERDCGILTPDSPDAFKQAQIELRKRIEPRHAKLIDWMLKCLDSAHNRSGFGYGAIAGTADGSYADNSCSQFGVLGLKAASLLGADVDPKLFKSEAARLTKRYTVNGSNGRVSYRYRTLNKKGEVEVHDDEIAAGGWDYQGDGNLGLSMTAGGVSSLAICRDELKVRGLLDDDFARKIDTSILGAQLWMSKNYYTLDGDRYLVRHNGIHRDPYYNLYSVERAGVLTGSPLWGNGLDWYAIGAASLIALQAADGSWSYLMHEDKESVREFTADPVSIAFAILFLKRAALPLIGTPPRKPIDTPPDRETPEPKPSSPVTPGGKASTAESK